MGKSTSPENYHHGNLADALVSAAVELIAERGTAEISMREVARRAGVSPGAPFRHFENKTALMTAVALEGLQRLRAAMDNEVIGHEDDDPLDVVEAMGVAYLDWAFDHTIYFHVLSTRDLLSPAGLAELQVQNDAIRAMLIDQFHRAWAKGILNTDASLPDLLVATRGISYGLARLATDRHFPEWDSTVPTKDATYSAYRMFIRSLRVLPASAC